MPADEPTRFRLHQRLAELLDPEMADAMMESMPPMPWHELATRDDLDQRFDQIAEMLTLQSQRMEADVATIRAELVAVEGRLSLRWMETTRLIVLAIFTLFLGTVGLIVGLAA